MTSHSKLLPGGVEREMLTFIIFKVSLVALGILSLALYHISAPLYRYSPGNVTYIATFIGQFAFYLLACYAVTRFRATDAARNLSSVTIFTLMIVLMFAAAFRARLVTEPPFLSSDVYRYIWDGRVQASGINPYRYIPAEEELAPLRDDLIYANINRKDFAHTIYPPVAQAIFLASYLVRPSSVTTFKVTMSLFDALAALAIMLALARARMDPALVIFFAWHPLVIWEGAHSGHIESASMAFLALALLCWTYEKRALTGVALALATLVKLYPIMLLPVFAAAKLPQGPASQGPASQEPGAGGQLRRGRGPGAGGLGAGDEKKATGKKIDLINLLAPGPRPLLHLAAAFILTIIIAYLPYLSVGAKVIGYLPGYLKEEGYMHAGNRYFLLSLVRWFVPLPTAAYSVFSALALLGFGVWQLLKPKRNVTDVARGAAQLIGLFMILSSPRYSWYVAWIIPFLCFAPRAAWLYLTGASVLLYLLWFTTDYPNIPLWLGAAIYVPALALFIRDRVKIKVVKEKASASQA